MAGGSTVFLVLPAMLFHSAAMTLSASAPDMRDLMAAVGEVLLNWGHVETAILDRLAATDCLAAKPPRISPLVWWKQIENATAEIIELQADVERLADIRNCLAHGLTSATADPNETREAAVVCHTLSGKQRIDFTTLTETRRSLHRLSHAIRALPSYNKRKSSSAWPMAASLWQSVIRLLRIVIADDKGGASVHGGVRGPVSA